MIVCNEQVRKGEKCGVQDTGTPTEDQHSDWVTCQCHHCHSTTVEHQTTNINWLSLKPFDQSFNDETIARTRQGIHRHSPAAKANALLIANIQIGARWSLKSESSNNLRVFSEMINSQEKSPRLTIFQVLTRGSPPKTASPTKSVKYRE